MQYSKLLFILLLVPNLDVLGQQKDNNSDSSSANEYMCKSSYEQLARAFDSSERDAWQKPDEVIEFLGDISNKVIVDVGSGSGYFTFRLVETGATVIAADVDEHFLKMIEEKQSEFGISKDKLKTRNIDENELTIEANSADIIFMVNVYHHISDRISYFSKVNSTLRENGKIVIVDFYKKALPVGPPKNHKVSKEVVLTELRESGYENINVESDLLEHQYIITAHKF